MHACPTDKVVCTLLIGIKDCESQEDIQEEHGLLKGLIKRLVKRLQVAKLTNHLGYVPHARNHGKSHNTCNGMKAKVVGRIKAPWSWRCPCKLPRQVDSS